MCSLSEFRGPVQLVVILFCALHRQTWARRKSLNLIPPKLMVATENYDYLYFKTDKISHTSKHQDTTMSVYLGTQNRHPNFE